VSLMAFIDSSINVASSGPRMESIMEGSKVFEGTTGVSGVEFEAAHSKSCFVRLSMSRSRCLQKICSREFNREIF
jgi:hypothetical protein